MKLVRVILFVVVHYSWNIYQLEVKNTSLNDDIKEEVYMQILLVILLMASVIDYKEHLTDGRCLQEHGLID